MEDFIFVDTETNGLPKDYTRPPDTSNNWPRIVQMAWILSDRGGCIKTERDFIIKPEGWSVGDSENIHGISQAVAVEKGDILKTVLEKFVEDLESVSVVVAHNVNFDRAVISSEMMRTGVRPKKRIFGFFCTMEGAKNIVKIAGRYGYKNPKLSEAYEHFFNKKLSGGHNAMADARACFDIFFKLPIDKKPCF